MPVLIADWGEPGVVVGHMRPLTKEWVKAPAVGEILRLAVAQVPLAWKSSNQRPVSKSRDQSRPIRGQYPGHVIIGHSYLWDVSCIPPPWGARAAGCSWCPGHRRDNGQHQTSAGPAGGGSNPSEELLWKYTVCIFIFWLQQELKVSKCLCVQDTFDNAMDLQVPLRRLVILTFYLLTWRANTWDGSMSCWGQCPCPPSSGGWGWPCQGCATRHHSSPGHPPASQLGARCFTRTEQKSLCLWYLTDIRRLRCIDQNLQCDNQYERFHYYCFTSIKAQSFHLWQFSNEMISSEN